MSPFQEVDHTADWALHVWAPSLEALFVEAARGMYALAGGPALANSGVARPIAVRAVDAESLLVAWLQELLYLTESQGLAFSDFRVQALTPQQLQAEVVGHAGARLEKGIKAVTYHNLRIQPAPDGYETTIVFDV